MIQSCARFMIGKYDKRCFQPIYFLYKPALPVGVIEELDFRPIDVSGISIFSSCPSSSNMKTNYSCVSFFDRKLDKIFPSLKSTIR